MSPHNKHITVALLEILNPLPAKLSHGFQICHLALTSQPIPSLMYSPVAPSLMAAVTWAQMGQEDQQECPEGQKEPTWAPRKSSTYLLFHPDLAVGLCHCVPLQCLKEKR